jgi:hypothetical protein
VVPNRPIIPLGNFSQTNSTNWLVDCAILFTLQGDRNLALYQARGGTQEAISSWSSLPK